MAQSDWDFENSNWTIDSGQYVSSPSSLKNTGNCNILSRRSNCQNLPQGRVIFWWRATGTALWLSIHMRNQAALGTADRQNCYTLVRTLSGSQAQVNRYEAGTSVWYQSFGTPAALLADTWYKFRVTWWNNWGKIRFRLERWNGSAWVQEGSDIEDSTNKWNTSSVNRVGLQLINLTEYHDDTELWGVLT